MPENGDGKKESTPTPTPMTELAVRDIVSDIVDATKGDKNDALERLVRRNERLQIDLDKAKTAIPDSSRILSESQLATFQAYKKIGSVEEITTAFSERDDLKTTTALKDREAQLRDAAGVHEMNPGLLVRLALQDNLVVDEIREEGDEDEKKKVAYVRVNKDGSKPIRLDHYVKQEWEEFMDGLSTEPASAQKGQPSGKRLAPAAERGSPSKSTGPITDEVVREKKLATGKYLSF